MKQPSSSRFIVLPPNTVFDTKYNIAIAHIHPHCETSREVDYLNNKIDMKESLPAYVNEVIVDHLKES